MLIIFVAVGVSSHFIKTHSEIPINIVVTIAVVTLIICISNFVIGSYICGKRYSLEASQALGQKNTILMTWFALVYISPLVALGPIFYIIFHNVYNSCNIFMFERKNKALKCK